MKVSPGTQDGVTLRLGLDARVVFGIVLGVVVHVCVYSLLVLDLHLCLHPFATDLSMSVVVSEALFAPFCLRPSLCHCRFHGL